MDVMRPISPRKQKPLYVQLADSLEKIYILIFIIIEENDDIGISLVSLWLESFKARTKL